MLEKLVTYQVHGLFVHAHAGVLLRCMLKYNWDERKQERGRSSAGLLKQPVVLACSSPNRCKTWKHAPTAWDMLPGLHITHSGRVTWKCSQANYTPEGAHRYDKTKHTPAAASQAVEVSNPILNRPSLAHVSVLCSYML